MNATTLDETRQSFCEHCVEENRYTEVLLLSAARVCVSSKASLRTALANQRQTDGDLVVLRRALRSAILRRSFVVLLKWRPSDQAIRVAFSAGLLAAIRWISKVMQPLSAAARTCRSTQRNPTLLKKYQSVGQVETTRLLRCPS